MTKPKRFKTIVSLALLICLLFTACGINSNSIFTTDLFNEPQETQNSIIGNWVALIDRAGFQTSMGMNFHNESQHLLLIDSLSIGEELELLSTTAFYKFNSDTNTLMFLEPFAQEIELTWISNDRFEVDGDFLFARNPELRINNHVTPLVQREINKWKHTLPAFETPKFYSSPFYGVYSVHYPSGSEYLAFETNNRVLWISEGVDNDVRISGEFLYNYNETNNSLTLIRINAYPVINWINENEFELTIAGYDGQFQTILFTRKEANVLIPTIDFWLLDW